MKKILIYLMIFTNGIDLYSMKNNISSEVDAQEMFRIFAKKGSTFEASTEVKDYIKTLDSSALNQLTYSIEGSVELVDYKNKGMSTYERQYGFSLVHVAIDQNLWWLINSLKEAGANLALESAPQTGSLTPLKLAYQKRYLRCMKALLIAGVTSKDDPFVLELIQIIAPRYKNFPHLWRLLNKKMLSNL